LGKKTAEVYVVELTEPFSAEDDRAMRTYYDQRASEYDDWYLLVGRYARRTGHARWNSDLQVLAERVRAFGTGRLLEIACGTGWWTRELAPHSRVSAIDFAPAMLHVARERLRSLSLGGDFVRADAYLLPFAEASFDSCFAGCWMSHVPNARLPELLDGIRRVLKKGGLMMVIDTGVPTNEPGRPVPGSEYYNPRILNDGSRHRVLKIDHTPESLSAALAPLGQIRQAWKVGGFVGVIVECC
jgi:ubiquinone/menaquinone biosynthesis C-methylase UbiE